MHTTSLRRVGGSVMLAVPPALLATLRLEPGAKVGIAIESGRLVVEPQQRRRYTLNELLAQCNPNARRARREQEWLDSKAVGGELIYWAHETRRNLARQSSNESSRSSPDQKRRQLRADGRLRRAAARCGNQNDESCTVRPASRSRLRRTRRQEAGNRHRRGYGRGAGQAIAVL